MTVIKIISITSLTLVSLAVLGSRVQAAKLNLPSVTAETETSENLTDLVFPSSLSSQDSVTGESEEPQPYQVYINADSVLPTVSSLAVSNLVGNADSNSDIELSNQPLNQNGHEIPEPSALVGIASIGAIVGLNSIFKKRNKKDK